MSSIAILEGDNSYDDLMGDYLGWSFSKAWKKTKRVTKRGFRVTKRIVRPMYRPVDRALKRIPVVRTAYRSAIASTYVATGQFGKVKRAYIRAGRSALKDLRFVKNKVYRISLKIMKPLIRKYGAKISKNAMKAMAIPSITSAVTAQVGPPGMPFIGFAVNKAINVLYRKMSGTVRYARRISSVPFEAEKMSYIPSADMFNTQRRAVAPPVVEKKKGFNPLLLLPLLALAT